MRSSPGQRRSRVRVGAAWALVAVALCAQSCSARLEVCVLPFPLLLWTNREGAALHQVGDTVGETVRADVHTECHPSVGTKHTLSDFDYQANGCFPPLLLKLQVQRGSEARLDVGIEILVRREVRN